MSGSLGRTVEVNGITYLWPQRPVIVVCIDGGDPEYLESCLSDGLIPNIEGFINGGFHAIAEGVVPSLTNPNNISIVTGSPPSVHGISGNYFLDPETGMEVMMNDPEFLRCDTVLSRFSREGARVVAITAKDKLRRLLGKDVDLAGGSIVFSAERADQCTPGVNGIEGVLDIVGLPLPDVYSPELSLFVLEAGINILERYSPDIMYLSLTDFVQHTWAPGEPEAKDFHRRLDALLGRLAEGGAVVGVTADHGMSDKSRRDDTPNVIYLQDELDARFGEGATQVVLPITDPYVVHHGALGGYARAYCRGDATPDDVARYVRQLPGVEAVYDRHGACAAFDLPPDREGDVAVIADAATAIGASEGAHDLSGLKGRRLRSHGGVAEARVPFILSAQVRDEYQVRASTGRLRNFHIFDYALNSAIA